MLRKTFILLLLFLSLQLKAQQWRSGDYHHPWVDSVLQSLSWQAKIAQMMMVPAWSNKGIDHTVDMENIIRNYQVGGIVFFQGNALKQAYYTNYYQQLSSVPLLIAIDGEWGLAMRLKGISKYPFQMTLGATNNRQLAYKTGFAIGAECLRLGIHVNFAPDVDVNTNAANPIIGFRSFGENPYFVSQLGLSVMKGMQDAGIIACAKHFPGHGDSKSDSHFELPLLSIDRNRLDSVELSPFRTQISEGVKSIMVGHLEIPALDTVQHRPSSLSPVIINDLLKTELGFKGLIFTDALDMKAVSRYYGPGYAELAAIKAGNDILVMPENIPKAIEYIMTSVRKGELDSVSIVERVRKILYFKMLAGLADYQPIETSTLNADLAGSDAALLNKEAALESITIVNDKNSWLPISQHTSYKIAHWAIGKNGNYPFSTYLNKYHNVDAFFTSRDSNYDVFGKMSDSLIQNYDQIIISIHDQNLWGSKSQFLPQAVVQNIYKIAEKRISTLVDFGNIYVLKNLPNLPCVIAAFEDDTLFQQVAADILFGNTAATAKLPATAAVGYEMGKGINTKHEIVTHFQNASPINAGFKKNFTAEMDSLLAEIIKTGAAPGGQILVLKNGNAVYHKPFGNFTYSESKKVQLTDVYDLASITKVAATTLSIMHLYDQDKIKLDAHIHNYLPEFEKSKKGKLTIRQLLLHETGLPAFIPFYKTADSQLYRRQRDSVHTVQICDSMWLDSNYNKVIWSLILECEQRSKKEYLYSDINLIIAAAIVERVSGLDVSRYAEKYFYTPMRLSRIGFNPYHLYNRNYIAPSSMDDYWRKSTIQGFVHDPSAAMLGGIAGNAGLFSTSEDLGKIFQMLLKGGEWNGACLLKSTTVAEFTTKAHKKTHRGLGFDKPNGLEGEHANISAMVPASMFGHTGFTGNWAWADPKNEIVFIFLSNRTYPNENNRKLTQYNFRTKAIEIVYGSL